MEFKEFKDFKINENSLYKSVSASYVIEDSIFYVEPSFHTQLINLEIQYKDEFDKIINSIKEIVLKNKKVIFTGNFDSPLLNIEGFIYRDIEDVLAYNKLTLDIKINPESDWKD